MISRRAPRTSSCLLLAGALLALAGPAPGALPIQAQGQGLPTLAPMLEEVLPGVVNISTSSTVRVQQNPLFNDPFFRRFFDLPPLQQERRRQSLGSGVIVDPDRGTILTNHHVIAGADQIQVTLEDGRSFEARLIGSDPDTDIAVIGIEADRLTAIDFADSDRVRVGDFVVAIGNPFGLDHTVTSGIVSGLGRSGLGIESYEDYIQTDASINPGNSGGALVDLNGRLVGINTAIIAPGGGNVGIGFAIPSNMARRLMEQIVEFGEVRRGQLGVLVQDLTADLARAFGVESTRGAVINRVFEGSAAAEAGLREGDIVIRIGQRRIDNSADLRNAIGLLRPGEEVEVEFLRDGRRRATTVRVTTPELARLAGSEFSPHLAGATLGENVPAAGEGPSGIVVVAVEAGSPAWRAGLRPDDVILAVNRRPLDDFDDLRRAVGGSAATMLLYILRDGSGFYLVIR